MVEQILARLRKRQHVLLTGTRGMGKSYRLQQVKSQLDPDKLMELSGGTARKALVTQLLQRCWDDEFDIGLETDHDDWKSVQKELRGETVDQLLVRCREHLARYTFVIDDLELMTARTCADLMPHLLTGIVVAAADVSSATQRKRIESVVNSFQRVELKPLDRSATGGLLWSLIDRDTYDRPRMIETQVWNKSRGVPGVVVEMIDQLGSSRSMRDVQELNHEAPAVNMVGLLPAVLIALIVFLVIWRVTSRGMNDPVGYAIAMAGYTIFRLVMRPLQAWADG